MASSRRRSVEKRAKNSGGWGIIVRAPLRSMNLTGSKLIERCLGLSNKNYEEELSCR